MAAAGSAAAFAECPQGLKPERVLDGYGRVGDPALPGDVDGWVGDRPFRGDADGWVGDMALGAGSGRRSGSRGASVDFYVAPSAL